MKLGNSNGNNTGKKYFIRGRDDQQDPTPENRKKADKFNMWFVDNRQILINSLISKNIYYDDIFSITFMRISEKILYSGIDLLDYKAYFHRSYFTNYIQDKEKESRYVPLPVYNNMEAHHSNPYQRERMQTELENDVFDYIYQRYSQQEFELFKMYMNLKPAVSYRKLSEITHVKAHNIQRIISKILVDIRGNKSLVNRYEDVI